MQVRVKNKYNNWQPAPSLVIKDKQLLDTIYTRGYDVIKGLNNEQLEKLQNLFNQEHQLEVKDGGMFYSLYSKDYEYRKRIHDEIQQILSPLLEDLFKDYKNVINSFVVKAPGPKSEFYVHQDTTAVDEFKHSPLSLWIPLHDITIENGAMCLVEKTHWFFSPYRGVSFNFPFTKINETVKPYLKPIPLKKGEILLFDPRVIHNSLANNSQSHRIAIICGIFHLDAKFITCFKDPNESNSPVELYEHDDDYLLKYPNFFYNCHERPVSGNVLDKVNADNHDMPAEEFIELCETNQVERPDFIASYAALQCNMIAEPDGVNKFEVAAAEPKKGFFSKLFSK